MTTEFQPGLALCAAFYAEAVRPLLAAAHPRLAYAAALFGPGSDVLGFDTVRSTDHDWGPRLQLFLSPADHARLAGPIDELLCRALPPTFGGFPTSFTRAADGVHVLAAGGPVRHRVVITTPDSWYHDRLGFQPHQHIQLLDWLATPTQLLLEETSGAVYHDDPGAVRAARAALAWYPDDLWRFALAAQWRRIAEEEAFVGRCTEVGDELGAAVVTARLVRDLARLHLLMARRYPPYSKWLGTALATLPDIAGPLLDAVHSTGPAREDALARAYERAAASHNELGLTRHVDPATRPYHSRPYRVLMADRFTDALRATVVDPLIAALPLTGAIDQFADSILLAGDREARRTATAGALQLPVVPAARPPQG